MSIRTNYRHTQYACYLGYITQAIVNNLAPLLFVIFQQAFAISLEKITLLVTGNFCLQLLVDLIAARFVDKIGYRPCVVAAHLFAAAGLIGMGTFPRLFPDPYAGLMLAVGLYAIGGGLIEVLISPIVEACPTENKASVMSLLHSFYCWGTVGVILLSTLFLQAAGRDSWSLLALLWAILPLCNAVYFTQVPIAPLTQEGESLPLGKLFSMKLFWVFALLMVAAGACEQAMSQWASAFAESGLGVSKAVGDLAGPCMFSVLMGLSRVAYAKWSDRLSLLNCEIACGLCCAGGYLLAALAPHPALALQRGLPPLPQGRHRHVCPAGPGRGPGLHQRPHPGGHGLRPAGGPAEGRPAAGGGVPRPAHRRRPGLQAAFGPGGIPRPRGLRKQGPAQGRLGESAGEQAGSHN